MLAMQEEEEKFRKMQQQQDAAVASENSPISDLSIPHSPVETDSCLYSPLRQDPGTLRDTDISRRSQEVAKKLDRVVDTYNASFRTTPEIIKSLTSPSKLPSVLSAEEALNSPAEIQEEQTLQMV